jgi:membrane-bound metal-dependent hydrolase YbcI (DUF457 family)
LPGYKGHLAGGFVLGGGILGTLTWKGIHTPDPPAAVALMTICLLGALFPDTDTDSKGQNLFYLCLVILDLVLMAMEYFKWAAIVGFCAMLPAIGHHRGWTHTWLAMILVPLPIILLPAFFYGFSLKSLAPFYLAAVVGYFSHLLLDRKFW